MPIIEHFNVLKLPHCHERTTTVFAKAGLDNATSAMCKHQQWFGLDIQFSSFVHNFSNTFSNEHLYQAGQSMNSVPLQILEHKGSGYDDRRF